MEIRRVSFSPGWEVNGIPQQWINIWFSGGPRIKLILGRKPAEGFPLRIPVKSTSDTSVAWEELKQTAVQLGLTHKIWDRAGSRCLRLADTDSLMPLLIAYGKLPAVEEYMLDINCPSLLCGYFGIEVPRPTESTPPRWGRWGRK